MAKKKKKKRERKKVASFFGAPLQLFGAPLEFFVPINIFFRVDRTLRLDMVHFAVLSDDFSQKSLNFGKEKFIQKCFELKKTNTESTNMLLISAKTKQCKFATDWKSIYYIRHHYILYNGAF